MNNMNLFSEEHRDVVDVNLATLEIGYRICERLRIKITQLSDEKAKEIATNLGSQYVNYCKTILPESLARITDVSTSVVPIKFILFVMKAMNYSKPFVSEVLFLRDTVLEYNIQIRLFCGVNFDTLSDVCENNVPFYVSDYTYYCNSFIQLISAEKLVDRPEKDLGQSLSLITKKIPTVFSAGYLYRSEYENMDANEDLLMLPERLEKRYRETLGALSINDYVGCCGDSITMATFPESLDTYTELAALKRKVLEDRVMS